ncbi:cupin domain-containing protein [Ramlibacter sp.]|uniref:cupin domain-containing protein n=1 Tax=Ramlibacter sp. TaxID=1917967 RepID=UPI0035B118C7
MDLTLRPPPPARARAMRHRLLARVADADATHLTIDAQDGEWQPFLPGVRIKVLREQAGVLSYLLELQPGASLPPHRHRVDEECVVVSGRIRVGTQHAVQSGGYHLAHAGALHAQVHTDTGALIFLRGAIPGFDDLLE